MCFTKLLQLPKSAAFNIFLISNFRWATGAYLPPTLTHLYGDRLISAEHLPPSITHLCFASFDVCKGRKKKRREKREKKERERKRKKMNATVRLLYGDRLISAEYLPPSITHLCFASFDVC